MRRRPGRRRRRAAPAARPRARPPGEGSLSRPSGRRVGLAGDEADLPGALDAMPAQMTAEEGRDDAVVDDEIGDLAVAELLQGQRPEVAAGLVVKAEGDPGEGELEEVEGEPVGKDRHRILEEDGVDSEEIDERGGEREDELEEGEHEHGPRPTSADAAVARAGRALVVGTRRRRRTLLTPRA